MRPFKKNRKLFRVLPWVLLVVGLPVWAGEVSEYKVKAAYLYNFAKFVVWPEKAFASKNAPLVIGVLGEDPFGGDLDKAVEGKSVGEHPIEVKRITDSNGKAEARGCQILFIGYSEKDRLPEILAATRGKAVLTVSEIERFTAKGGMILFDQEGSRITLAINQTAAEKAGLAISSQLLQVALIYKGE